MRDREQYLAYQREYREKNREKLKEKAREKYRQNPEPRKEAHKRWAEKNREKISEYHRKRYVPKKKDNSGLMPPADNVIEVWKDIKGYDGDYMVSNYGRVWSRKSNRLIGFDTTLGYRAISIDDKKIYIHRLVAEAFIPNPNNLPEIDHIDTDKTNNVWTNLRWVDRKENLNNPITIERFKESNKGKVTEQMYDALRKINNVKVDAYTADGKYVDTYDSMKIAGECLGVDKTSVSACCRGIQKTTGGYTFRYANSVAS